jgi:hypothetical protein
MRPHCVAELSHSLNQAAPLRGAGSGAPRAGLWPWRGPARRARAVPDRASWLINGLFGSRAVLGAASFSAP